MTKKAQNPAAIMQPEDVESFDFYEEYNMFVAPMLVAAQNIMNKYGIPHIWITTPRVHREGSNIQSSHAIRVNNLNLVRDFALTFSHAAITAQNHTDLGTKIAELGLNSNEFMEAFFAHCEKAGVFEQVITKVEDGSQTPPNVH